MRSESRGSGSESKSKSKSESESVRARQWSGQCQSDSRATSKLTDACNAMQYVQKVLQSAYEHAGERVLLTQAHM